jgi:hypothetical protein
LNGVPVSTSTARLSTDTGYESLLTQGFLTDARLPRCFAVAPQKQVSRRIGAATTVHQRKPLTLATQYHPRRTAEHFHLTSRFGFILSVLVNEIQVPLFSPLF